MLLDNKVFTNVLLKLVVMDVFVLWCTLNRVIFLVVRLDLL